MSALGCVWIVLWQRCEEMCALNVMRKDGFLTGYDILNAHALVGNKIGTTINAAAPAQNWYQKTDLQPEHSF